MAEKLSEEKKKKKNFIPSESEIKKSIKYINEVSRYE